MRLKGQSAVEYMMMVGLALLITAPFIASMEASVEDATSTSDGIEMTSSLDAIQSSINTVGAEGEPSRRSVTVNLPDFVFDSEITGDRGIIFNIETARGESQVFTIVDYDVEEVDEGLPDSGGTYKFRAEAWRDQVNITWVEE